MATENVRWRLSVMMFLEYMIWGAWFPLAALYLADTLKFSGLQIAWVFATLALASFAAVFVSGQLADRYFSTEKFLAASHLVGGIAMLLLTQQKSFPGFFLCILLHNLAYVPTLSLTNAISFRHLKDAEGDFGRVRLWGTIGWIAASTPFIFILANKHGAELDAARPHIFTVAGVLSLLLAGFSLFLPATPPAPVSERKSAFAPFRAIGLLRTGSLAVLFLVTFMDSLVHQCYFQWTSPFLAHIGIPDSAMMPVMSIGQVAEIATMAALGWFLRRLGWRKIMIFGILGHALRFFIYTLQIPWLVVASNAVHGFAYAFFFASVYIFVDQEFPKDARASAQGLFNFVILGFGPFVGSLLWGAVGDATRTAAGAVDFSKLFLYPAGLAVAAALILFVGFHPTRQVALRPGKD